MHQAIKKMAFYEGRGSGELVHFNGTFYIFYFKPVAISAGKYEQVESKQDNLIRKTDKC